MAKDGSEMCIISCFAMVMALKLLYFDEKSYFWSGLVNSMPRLIMKMYGIKDGCQME